MFTSQSRDQVSNPTYRIASLFYTLEKDFENHLVGSLSPTPNIYAPIEKAELFAFMGWKLRPHAMRLSSSWLPVPKITIKYRGSPKSRHDSFLFLAEPLEAREL